MPDHNYFANLLWQIADLLRGPYRPPQYERVMLPMNVPLKDDIDDYFEREVRPHVPDAWMDRDKVGYEINFNRHFYTYTPPRPLEAIDAELKEAEEEIARLLREVMA